MNKLLNEFKAFAMRGNVLDMAVGVIIGAAFGKIVSSTVDDILMPALSLVIGGLDFTSLTFTLGSGDNAAQIRYGNFIQNIVDFLIIAFCIFLLIKVVNNFLGKKEETPKEPLPPSNEEKLLGEIRDLLKDKN